MSSYTTNLRLFKYNTATDGKQVFSIDDAMNDNWDKIDAFAKAIKDLSNLSSVGEKRFTNINNELSQKLEAQVSLAQNGYIKFNNGVILQYGFLLQIPGPSYTLVFPVTFQRYRSVIVQTTPTSITYSLGRDLNSITISNISNSSPTNWCWIAFGF